MLKTTVTLCLLFLTSVVHADIHNVTIEPKENDANGTAHYRLWIPAEVETLRGIIVRQHGCGPGARKFGLEHADDPQWQALANGTVLCSGRSCGLPKKIAAPGRSHKMGRHHHFSVPSIILQT
jgi:hypothetical protein